MILIWGTKFPRKRLGRVADLCPACVSVTAHSLSEVREVSHIYYVGIGRGKPVGHELKCETCEGAFETDAAHYQAVSGDAEARVDALVDETNPDLYEKIYARKDLEERAARGALSAEERMRLMQEALEPVARVVEARASQVHFDLRAGAGILAAILITVTGALANLALGGRLGENLSTLSGVLALVAALFVVHALATDVNRFIQRCQAQNLVQALGRFHPSPTELDELLASFRRCGWVLGRKLKSEALAELLLNPTMGSDVPRIG